jgi:hypothetical protein
MTFVVRADSKNPGEGTFRCWVASLCPIASTETLDDLAPSDNSAWRDDVPITIREKRWLELYQKHEDAWRKMQAERVARPRPR